MSNLFNCSELYNVCFHIHVQILGETMQNGRLRPFYVRIEHIEQECVWGRESAA